jgi:hypothetical protein
MSLTIKANTFATQRYLQITPTGVVFCETAFTGGKRTFRFQEIDNVLMSTENVLSFQVGQEVFSLPVKPTNSKHQETINAMIQGVGQTG